jgi:hypothetical protein
VSVIQFGAVHFLNRYRSQTRTLASLHLYYSQLLSLKLQEFFLGIWSVLQHVLINNTRRGTSNILPCLNNSKLNPLGPGGFFFFNIYAHILFMSSLWLVDLLLLLPQYLLITEDLDFTSHYCKRLPIFGILSLFWKMKACSVCAPVYPPL